MATQKWRVEDFCEIDEGLDYVFANMGAIYGATFLRHWDGIDAGLVRNVWSNSCGKMLTYRPKIDYALNYMNPDYPPSALAFAKLLNSGPNIPDKPHMKIELQKTSQEIIEEQIKASESKERLKQILEELKNSISYKNSKVYRTDKF